MIQKNDLIILLTEMQEQGVEISSQLKKTIMASDIPLDVVKFINDHRQIDIAAFYERIRKNYNDKKSSLYINLVKEEQTPSDIITTLSALALQINLYSKHVENKTMFFKHSRIVEISATLANYYKTFDFKTAITLLSLIKADLKCFETLK